MTHLLLVRHGETVWHAENRYAGISDIALTPRGIEQAELLAQWVPKARIATVWVSPLSRAAATARPAAKALKVTPQIDARLREIDFGQAEGKTMAELEQQIPEEAKAFKADPADHPFPGGEKPVDAARRAVECFEEIAHRHPDERVLVVAHNTLIRLALCQLLGIPMKSYRTVFPSLYNGALTEIRLKEGKAALLQFNAPLAPAMTASHRG